MALKFLKDNLPWVAPSVAIVLAASGYFDRGSSSTTASVETQITQPVQAAATSLVTNAVVSQASDVAVQPTIQAQNVADEEQVVARADTGISTSLAALSQPVDEAKQPSFTDTRPVIVEEAPSQQVVTLEQNPADFFRDAQATLDAAGSCKDDLRTLAGQARVYFPSGGLTAEEIGIEQARLIGTVVQNCSGVGVLVTGHSDPSGDPAANLRLSQKRAELVIQRIGASGIDTSKFVPQGFGDRRPSGITGPETRAHYDRRVEFSIVDLSATASVKPRATLAFTPSCVAQLEVAVLKTKLFYAPRSIAVQSEDMDVVMKLAEQAMACPEARLRVIGHHTDDAWAKEDVNTGILRAKALMANLVGRGITSTKVIIAAPSRAMGVPGQPELSKSRVDFDVIIDPI